MPIFEPKDVNREMAELVYGMLVPLQRGEILSNEAIEAAIGRPVNEGRAWIDKARDALLRQDGRGTVAVAGVGLRVMMADEQVREAPANRMRRAARQIRRGHAEVSNTPDGELGQHLRHIKHMVSDHMVRAEREHRANRELLKVMCRPSEVNPIPAQFREAVRA